MTDGKAPPPAPQYKRCPTTHPCNARAAAPHTCPFAVEINDSDEECECCESCERECAMDV